MALTEVMDHERHGRAQPVPGSVWCDQCEGSHFRPFEKSEWKLLSQCRRRPGSASWCCLDRSASSTADTDSQIRCAINTCFCYVWPMAQMMVAVGRWPVRHFTFALLLLLSAMCSSTCYRMAWLSRLSIPGVLRGSGAARAASYSGCASR